MEKDASRGSRICEAFDGCALMGGSVIVIASANAPHAMSRPDKHDLVLPVNILQGGERTSSLTAQRRYKPLYCGHKKKGGQSGGPSTTTIVRS